MEKSISTTLTLRDLHGLKSVATQHDVTQRALVRSMVRYCLSHPDEFDTWVQEVAEQ